MNFEPSTYTQTETDPGLFNLLLARIWRLLMTPFASRAEFEAYREEAYRTRGAIAHVTLTASTKKQNTEVLAHWSGEASYWFKSVQALWLRVWKVIYKAGARLRANNMLTSVVRKSDTALHSPAARTLLAPP